MKYQSYPKDNDLYKVNINDKKNIKLALHAFKLWLCAIWSPLLVASTLQMDFESSLNINSISNYFECARCSPYEIIASISEQ